MGNTSIKEKFSLFNNIKQEIIVKHNNDIVYSNKQAISNNIPDSENHFQNIKTVEIDCQKYDIYSNRLIPNLVNHGNNFILTYKQSGFHFSFLSDGVLDLLNLTREYLIHNTNIFFTLIYPKDKIIFDRDLENTIDNRDTKWKWIGKIKINNQYQWFQMDSTIEYYRHYINIYTTLTNISLLADLYQQKYDKIILDSCTDSKYGIPSNIPNTDLENSYKSIHIKTQMDNYINCYCINDYHIDQQPEYIIYNKTVLSNILDHFFMEKILSFNVKITTYDIEFTFWYSNHFQPSNKVIDLIIKYNGQYIYKSSTHYIIRLPYTPDELTNIRPYSLSTNSIKKYDKSNTIFLIDHNKAQKNYIEKFLTYNGYNVISNDNFNHINKNDNIIIYNTSKDFTIDKIRKLGYHNPIIISHFFDDIGYNYQLDYPFDETILLAIITEIYTKIKILYIDANLNNIALNTSILQKKLQYDLDIQNDLSIFFTTDNLEKYQLIIIDDSITNKEQKYFSKFHFISKIDIPIIYMCYDKNLHNSFFTHKLVKPFSIDTLEKMIIECL